MVQWCLVTLVTLVSLCEGRQGFAQQPAGALSPVEGVEGQTTPPQRRNSPGQGSELRRQRLRLLYIGLGPNAQVGRSASPACSPAAAVRSMSATAGHARWASVSGEFRYGRCGSGGPNVNRLAGSFRNEFCTLVLSLRLLSAHSAAQTAIASPRRLAGSRKCPTPWIAIPCPSSPTSGAPSAPEPRREVSKKITGTVACCHPEPPCSYTIIQCVLLPQLRPLRPPAATPRGSSRWPPSRCRPARPIRR